MLKRLFSIFTISLILTGVFFNAYTIKCPVYADSNTDQWMNVTTNKQLAEAFRYYCKSRNLTIEGSTVDLVTKFTTRTFEGLCNSLGIDMTALQAQIKYQTDDNLGTKFLFSALSIDAYNRIFAEFLQNNDLEVGDEADEENNTIYSEMVFIDDLGIATKVYKSPVITGSILNYTIEYGEPYKLTGSEIYENWLNGNTTFTFDIMNGQYVKNIVNGSGYINSKQGKYIAVQNNVSPAKNLYIYESTDDVASGHGNFAFIYNTSNGKLYYGIYSVVYDNVTGNKIHENINNYGEILNSQPSTAIIYLTTNNNFINNNTYEGDTIINNEGDVIYNPDPDPDPDPDPTPDPPTIPDTGGWQDFTLPEMPNDWLIYGMEKKFPFDIPFNILFGLSLLNHEPEIPQFEGDIDLKVCTWHYDIDLTPFDDIAKILRKFEVLAFIIGLAMITKELIMWG